MDRVVWVYGVVWVVRVVGLFEVVELVGVVWAIGVDRVVGLVVVDEVVKVVGMVWVVEVVGSKFSSMGVMSFLKFNGVVMLRCCINLGVIQPRKKILLILKTTPS